MSDTTFLKFRLGRASFGLPVAQVEETIRVVALAPVPARVQGLLGIANVRGRVIPVFDLCETLGQPRRALSLRMYIVIASLGAAPVGLLVDDVLDVVSVPEGQYQLGGALGGGDSYTAGVARVGEEMLTVLSLAPLLVPAAAGRAAAEPPEGA
jgi:purine-binding chemotaxis protein CheW